MLALGVRLGPGRIVGVLVGVPSLMGVLGLGAVLAMLEVVLAVFRVVGSLGRGIGLRMLMLRKN